MRRPMRHDPTNRFPSTEFLLSVYFNWNNRQVDDNGISPCQITIHKATTRLRDGAIICRRLQSVTVLILPTLGLPRVSLQPHWHCLMTRRSCRKSEKNDNKFSSKDRSYSIKLLRQYNKRLRCKSGKRIGFRQAVSNK